MSESKLTPADTLTLDDIQEMVEVAASMSPKIKPASCKCGKHNVYWVFAAPGRSRDEVLDILSQDKQHVAFIEHISECGFTPLELHGNRGIEVEVRE